MKNDKKKLILYIGSYFSLILLIGGITGFLIWHVEKNTATESTSPSKKEVNQTIQDYLKENYDLTTNDYHLTKVRSNYVYEDEESDTTEDDAVTYQATVLLNDPAIHFTIELDDTYKVDYDSYVYEASDYYLKSYLVDNYQEFNHYFQSNGLHSYSFLAKQKDDTDYVAIQIDFGNKKFKKIVTNLLKEKQPLDFKQLFKENHYVAWIDMELYTDKSIDENRLNQIEYDLKNQFQLLSQTYTLSLEQVDFTDDTCSITADDYSEDCPTPDYYYQEFRGNHPDKENRL